MVAYDELYGNKPQSLQRQIPGLGADGESDVQEALQWISANKSAYDFMVQNARRLYAQNGWVSINYLVNMVRNEMQVGVKNGLAPALSRIIEEREPRLKSAFKKHASRSDGYV